MRAPTSTLASRWLANGFSESRLRWWATPMRRTWCRTRIAVNLSFSHHRRGRRLRELLPALLPRRAAPPDLGLRELVEQLPARERTVLVLHYGHGYRLEEIAALLDLTHTNVRTIIARTRKRLHAAWLRSEGLEP
jgi:DNA-directed RNA polymerase specialized sigma24 family protein